MLFTPNGLDKFRQPSDELEPNERKLLRASLSHLVQAIIQENGQFTFSASLTAPQASKDDDQPAHFELNIIIHDGKTRKASDNNKELLKMRISQGPASGAYFVTYIKANGKNPQPEIDEIITAEAEIPMPRTEDPSNKVDIESLTEF